MLFWHRLITSVRTSFADCFGCSLGDLCKTYRPVALGGKVVPPKVVLSGVNTQLTLGAFSYSGGRYWRATLIEWSVFLG